MAHLSFRHTHSNTSWCMFSWIPSTQADVYCIFFLVKAHEAKNSHDTTPAEDHEVIEWDDSESDAEGGQEQIEEEEEEDGSGSQYKTETDDDDACKSKQ